MHALLTRTTGLLGLAVAGLLMPAGKAGAQSLEHLDRMAVQRQAKELHREIDTHARNASQYGDLHRDVGELERLTAHLHEAIERRAGKSHIQADVKKIDRHYHHVDRVVNAALRSGAVSRRGVADIRRALDQVDRTVHHLEDHLD